MKKVLLASMMGLLCLAQTQAQNLEYKAKLGNTKDKKVIFEMAASSVKIEGYNGDEVLIQASSVAPAPPDRAKGLKPLYQNGTDNTGIGLSVTNEGGSLRVEKVVRKDIKYTVKLPKNVAVLFQELNWQGGKISVSNMDGDLEVKTNNADIMLSNITGPVVANSTSGSVTAVFSNLSQAKPTSISVISGELDVTLPASTKADMKLRSINGEMYTDFDLGKKSAPGGLSRVGGAANIEGTVNGGGVEFTLNTISSNIYIRKK